MRTEDFRLPAQWNIRLQEEFVAAYDNDAGDTLSLNHFPREPDIAADISDAHALRAFYRNAAESNQVAMVEVDPAHLAGLPAVRTILKARLEPTGFAFIGCFTFPFSDCSYVIKVQSVERGMTGVREAVVMDMAIQEEPVEVDELTGKLVGWEQDPYDPTYRGSFMRNQADDPQYDDRFPEHPLTKVRRYLGEISSELEVAPSIRESRPFKYKASGASLWSRLWS
jgi:hypothetical protein